MIFGPKNAIVLFGADGRVVIAAVRPNTGKARSPLLPSRYSKLSVSVTSARIWNACTAPSIEKCNQCDYKFNGNCHFCVCGGVANAHVAPGW